MRKLSQKNRRHQSARRKYQLKHHQRFKLYRRNKGYRYLSKSKIKRIFEDYLRDSVSYKAPENFILKDNPEEVLAFIQKVKNNKSNKVFINLSSVTRIHAGSIAMLTSVVGELSDKNIKCRGNRPNDNHAREVFERSGFFNIVTGEISPENINDDNKIIKRGKSKVIQKETAKYIKKAMKTVSGEEKKNTSLQRILIEMMNNSVQHAYKNSLFTNYWISFYHDRKEKKVCIVFLDNGQGIIKTLNRTFWDSVTERFKTKSNSELLYQILMDKDVAIRNAPGRGRGLPAIYKKSASFSNFTVISNRAFIDLENNTTRDLLNNYNGTFYYFELINKISR